MHNLLGQVPCAPARPASDLFQAGYTQALTLAAQRVDELDAIWRPIERPRYEQQVATRLAQMEEGAARQERFLRERPRPSLAEQAATWADRIKEIDPEPCDRCTPRWPVLCRCAGVATVARDSNVMRRAA